MNLTTINEIKKLKRLILLLTVLMVALFYFFSCNHSEDLEKQEEIKRTKICKEKYFNEITKISSEIKRLEREMVENGYHDETQGVPMLTFPQSDLYVKSNNLTHQYLLCKDGLEK